MTKLLYNGDVLFEDTLCKSAFNQGAKKAYIIYIL